MRSRNLFLIWSVCIIGASLASALDVGSNGSDGAFAPVKGAAPWDLDNDGVVTLRPEVFDVGDGRSIDARNGIFHWTSVTIPAGVTVLLSRDRITSSTYNPPIQFLAQTTITIAGTLRSNGQA